MRSAFGQVSERATLHIHEGFFPCWMHDFEDKSPRVGRGQAKIVVVFTWEGVHGSVKTVQLARDAPSLGERSVRSNAGFGHHAGNCNRRTRGRANEAEVICENPVCG